MLQSLCQQIWKTQQWPQDWKKSVFIPIPKKGKTKECSDYPTIAFISHARKVILKILQDRPQEAGFRNSRGTRNQIAKIHWITEKAREFQKKTSISAKAFVWITKNCRKFLKRWEYQTTLPASWETCIQVKKQQLELDMEQWTGSKLGKV